jgi:outer membrane protein TolC
VNSNVPLMNRCLSFVLATCCCAELAAADRDARATIRLSLTDAIATALEGNRDLQIERVNPAIARAGLGESYGYYDPIFLGDLRRETDADTGGFDPLNFSNDAVYEADSLIANAGLSGFLPSGLSYNIGGSYAQSDGTRNSLDFDSYRLFTGITLRQPLLRNFWIDAGRYAIKINKRNVKLSDLGVRFIAIDVINRVEQAYWELAYAYEARHVGEQLVDARQRLLDGTRRKIEHGLAAAPDEQLAQAQLATAETTLAAALTSIELAENALRTHLGDGFTNQLHTRWAPADPMLLLAEDFSLARSWERGIQTRPDLAQLRVELEKAQIDVRYRFNQLFPTLDVIGSYGRRGASTDQDVPPFKPRASLSDAAGQISRGDAPRDMIGLIFSVPLSRKAERSSYKAAKYWREQSGLRVKQKEEFVLREISDAFHTARTSFDRAKSARRAVEAARGALQAEERRLAGGTSSIFFVLQLQNDLTSAQLAEARARADYNKAVAQWQFAEGSSLERRNVLWETGEGAR